MQEPDQTENTTDESAAPAIPGIADAIDNMPEPQEHAIAEAERQSAEAAEVKTDQHGTPFDPNIHSGTLTPSGRWRMKKGAAPNSRVGTSRSIAPPTAQNAPAVAGPDPAMIAQANAAGAAAAESIIALCRAFGGDDFNPIKSQSEDERAALHDAWAQYFIATGKTFSPGWLLVAANGGYIARRFTMPKTQTRMATLREKLAVWIAKRRARKAAGTAPTSEIDISAER